ncbi:MAG: hypothetical protein E5W70_29835 [Mesorhizobium sp.]|uniref:hypothetical protein n=1 Tax=Mesorhizobium sp. TaxID=1871066 RepID=UPI00120FCE68|nr:hypothetical protein [Mesorhizobium sp.]TIT18263.1 MAG: hypothetical protein E5W70_29835 [Mesorhizobium sp.]
MNNDVGVAQRKFHFPQMLPKSTVHFLPLASGTEMNRGGIEKTPDLPRQAPACEPIVIVTANGEIGAPPPRTAFCLPAGVPFR